MPVTVAVRDLLASVGGLLAVTGMWVLLSPIMATADGPASVQCGSALLALDMHSPPGRAACEEPISDHRQWGWSILIGGVAVAASAMIVDSPHRRHARGDNRR